MKFKYFLSVLSAAALVHVASDDATSQALPRVVAAGLKAPTKMIVLRNRAILVAENGDGPNTGRVSVVSDGRRDSLVDGLPSGPSAPNNAASGVSALLVDNRTLFLAIGAGDASVAGPAQGSELPNPRPSSPILSSVLAMTFTTSVEQVGAGFQVSVADHAALAAGQVLTLRNPGGQSATLQLVADIPDHLPEPRPDVPANVRGSNPFGLERADSCTVWLADAARNTIFRVDHCRKTFAPAVVFPPYASPLATGPRLLDAVPTSVRTYGGDLLVSFLSGAPFVAGLAEVKLVKATNGETRTFLGGLRMVLDVAYYDGAPDGLFVIEFSQDPAAGLPGRLLYYDSPQQPPAVLTTALITPTSLAIDGSGREVLITEYGPGRIVAVPIPR